MRGGKRLVLVLALVCPLQSLEAKTTTLNVFDFLSMIQKGQRAEAVKMIHGKIETSRWPHIQNAISSAQFVQSIMKCHISSVSGPSEKDEGYAVVWSCNQTLASKDDAQIHEIRATIEDGGDGVNLYRVDDQRFHNVQFVPAPNPGCCPLPSPAPKAQ